MIFFFREISISQLSFNNIYDLKDFVIWTLLCKTEIESILVNGVRLSMNKFIPNSSTFPSDSLIIKEGMISVC